MWAHHMQRVLMLLFDSRVAAAVASLATPSHY